MARFRNHTTGVVVHVADSKADRFGSDWEPLDDGPAGSPATGGGYAGMKVAALRGEIAERNTGRDDDAKIDSAGVKAELVAALEADDQAHEEIPEG